MMRDGRTVVVCTALAATLSTFLPDRGLCAEVGQLTFGGRVLDTAGRPVEGARVRFYREQAGDIPGKSACPLAGDMTTGPEGTYAFSFSPQDGEYDSGYLVAEKSGLAIGFASGETNESRTFDLTLGEPTPLAGVVVDDADKPIVDASVGVYLLLIGQEPHAQGMGMQIAPKLLATQTDAAGRFSFPSLPAGASVELVVKKPGRATVCTFDPGTYRGQSFRYAVGRTDVRIIQPVESRIEGIVVQKGADTPVGGVGLTVTGADNRPLDGYDQTVQSGPDGRFSVSALPAGEYRLQLTSPQNKLAEWVGVPVAVALDAGQTKTGVQIEVSKGGILEIAVSDAANGRPVEKASVSIRVPTYNQWISSVTDAEGVARTRLSGGSYEVQGAYRQGYMSGDEMQPVTIEEGSTKRLAVSLKEMPRVRGVVRDPSGAALADAQIRILPSSREKVTSNADGWFELAWNPRSWGEQDMVFCLVARHEQRNLAGAFELSEGSATFDAKLDPGITLTGRVVNPNGQGISGARIRPMLNVSNWGSSLSDNEIKTGSDGHFQISALPAGRRYSLYAGADGYGRKDTRTDVDGAVDGVLDVGVFTLPLANLSITGQVVDPDGNPVANARIDTYGEEQPDRLEARTDAEGRFKLDGVCDSRITLLIQAGRGTKKLTADILTDGGAADLRIVLREGRAPVQYLGGKSYEQVLATNEKAIAGVALDEGGSPVAGVPVQVCCHKAMRDGRMSWRFADYRGLSATSDAQGRFAIPTQEDGEYNLLFSPDRLAAIIVYDVPVGKRDLSVTLPEGGTVVGRLLRIDKGRKVPIPNAEVKVEQTSRASFSHLGFDRDRTIVTDAEGRFRVGHLCTQIREDHNKAEFLPRTWQISHGEVSATIVFDKGARIDDFELVVRPDPAKAPPLTGRPLPDFAGIKIDLDSKQLKDRRVLVCFFDWEQRPSRNCVSQLAKQADSLKAKGVAIAAVSVAPGDETALQTWVKENAIPFPIGTIQGDRDETLSTWSVKSLPWLVLADTNHNVTAEGFALDDLARKIDPQ
ncbi:MAG: carboxypeptidase regulatory-like domain-containing protein [Phycisphaerae bacterium]|nr:carboxypeptidase regulatory-like domain-containing protein [Phycisphaerae bacterium]